MSKITKIRIGSDRELSDRIGRNRYFTGLGNLDRAALMNFTQEQWPFEKGPCDPIRSHQIHSIFSIFVSFRTLSKSRIAISHLLPFANNLSKVAYLSFASESLGIEFLNKTVPAVVIVTLSVV